MQNNIVAKGKLTIQFCAMTSYAPIALFVFNRPTHTQETLELLTANPEFRDSPLYIFCDGPRQENEVVMVDQVRQIARRFSIPTRLSLSARATADWRTQSSRVSRNCVASTEELSWWRMICGFRRCSLIT